MSLFDGFSKKRKSVSSGNLKAETENARITDNRTDDPDYGLVTNKPVTVKGIDASYAYIRSLKTSSGQRLTWRRLGSTSDKEVDGIIDIYISYLPSGKEYKVVYVNMYGTKNDAKLPAGFSR